MINDYEATKPMTEDAVPISTTSRAVTSDTLISTLNGLIQTCKDGEEGFRQAAQAVGSAPLKTLFQELSSQRADFAADLQAQVRSLGGEPETSGSFTGTLHRGWMELKTAIMANEEKSVLNTCESAEDAAIAAYREALKTGLPADVTETVGQQFAAVQSAHNKIKALRDTANEAANSARA